MGGVRIDEKAESDVPGLYAAGEASGGIHGGGRLGGNGISSPLVFGARAGMSAAMRARSMDRPEPDEAEVNEKREHLREISKRKASREGDVKALTTEFRSLMWEHAGVIRSKQDLETALLSIDRIHMENIPKLYAENPRQLLRAVELMKMVDVGEMIARAALMRTETRTCHFRIDYPKMDNKKWLKNILLRKKDGKMKLWTEPVVVTRLQPPEG